MNESNGGTNEWRDHRVGRSLTILALMGSVFLATCVCGCGTDDWNTDQSGSTQVTHRETPATAAQPAEVPESAPEVALAEEQGEIVSQPRVQANRQPKQSITIQSRPPSYDEAEAAYQQGDYDTAARGFAAHVKDNPESAWGLYMLGLTHWKRGEYVAAATALERATALRPDLVEAHVSLARVQLDANRPSEAHRAAKKAVGLEPADAGAKRVLARSLHNLGLADQALDVYREVLSLDPRDAWAMNNMGLILIEEERFPEAIGPLAQAVKLAPDGSVFCNNLGVALERAGFLTDAAQIYRQTLAIDSTYARAAVSLDRVLAHLPEPNPRHLDVAQRAAQFETQVQEWHGGQTPKTADLSKVEVSR